MRDRVPYPKMVYDETFKPVGYKIVFSKEEHDELIKLLAVKGPEPVELANQPVKEVVKRTRNRAKKSETGLMFELGD